MYFYSNKRKYIYTGLLCMDNLLFIAKTWIINLPHKSTCRSFFYFVQIIGCFKVYLIDICGKKPPCQGFKARHKCKDQNYLYHWSLFVEKYGQVQAKWSNMSVVSVLCSWQVLRLYVGVTVQSFLWSFLLTTKFSRFLVNPFFR